MRTRYDLTVHVCVRTRVSVCVCFCICVDARLHAAANVADAPTAGRQHLVYHVVLVVFVEDVSGNASDALDRLRLRVRRTLYLLRLSLLLPRLGGLLRLLPLLLYLRRLLR